MLLDQLITYTRACNTNGSITLIECALYAWEHWDQIDVKCKNVFDQPYDAMTIHTSVSAHMFIAAGRKNNNT